MHVRSCEAVVHQVNHPRVLLGAYHAASGLHDLLQAGVEVGVVVGFVVCLIFMLKVGRHAGFDFFIHGIDLRQPQRGYERTNQPAARQVNAFGKRAAQHRKADALRRGCEAAQKLLAPGLVHLPGLRPRADMRVALGEAMRQLLQVVVAAGKGQIVARCAFILLRHHFGNQGHGLFAVVVAGRHIAHRSDSQLFWQKRRGHVDPGGAERQAQRVFVKLRRAERG